VPEIESLGPKTAEKVIDEIHAESIRKTVNPDDPLQKKILVHPVSIDVVTTAPIDTLSEAQKIYYITLNVTMDILAESHATGKKNPMLLGWMKETREQLKLIHSMTAGFQQKVGLKKIELMAALINSSADLREDFKIRMIKELEQVETAAESPQIMEIEE